MAECRLFITLAPGSGLTTPTRGTGGTLYPRCIGLATGDGVARLSGNVMVSDGPTAGIRGGVRAIHRDRSGDFWIGCQRGLYRLHGVTITHFTHDDGLGSDDVQVIREGRNGALWVGT